MAILFDWYENPKNKERQNEELTLHPRIRLNGSTDTAALRRFIQEYCSLTETDVSAVLDALSHFMGRELGEGRQVHLDGIGYFRPTLTCTEPVKVDTKRKSTKVKLKSITFRPDMALRSEVGNIKVLPLKQRNVLQKPLTPEEIDKRLEKFFTTHDFMTKGEFYFLTGVFVMKENWKIKGCRNNRFMCRKRRNRKIISGICVFVWSVGKLLALYLYLLPPPLCCR